MEIVKFPEKPKRTATMANDWLRKIAGAVEENYGKDVAIYCAVVTFMDENGSVYLYDFGDESSVSVTSEIGLLGLAQQHLMNVSSE